METPLLATKLAVPPARPGLVARPRLVERLHAALSYSLALISAPAGFGKTTLLSEWIRLSQPKVHTAWVSLDEGDNDPVRFWDYFVASVQTLQPGCGEKIVPWLRSSRLPSTESMMTALINDLSRVTGDCVVVLDDYHLIESQQIHDGITYLIEHLPVHLHLVIAARADPPLRLARLRGKGSMLEIRTDDLRFTPDDAAALLREMKMPGLAARDIAALTDRTEGWAVGLKMAALSLSGQKDIPSCIAAFTGSQRYIMDYLIEEVLQKQSQGLRDFLIKTSVLERLTAPLCGVLTGRKDSQDMLLDLERRRLFIVPLDESRRWYRYEHLFADLLRHQCGAVYGTDQVAALHRQASEWYEDNNLLDEAMRHALAAKDWPWAVGLLNAHCEEKRKRGESSTLLGWFQAIPDGVLREHLSLYSKYAALLSQRGHVDAAEAALGYLETAAQDDTALKGEVAYSRGVVYRYRGDLKRYLELSEKAFALLPPNDVAMRGRAAASIAHVRQRLGPIQESKEWATKAYELGQQAGDIWTVVSALGFIGNMSATEGKLKLAVEMYKKADESAGRAGSPVVHQTLLCLIQYILNDLKAADESACLAVESAQLSDAMPAAMIAYSCQAKICLARGDAAAAAAAMQKMDQASRHSLVDSWWHADYVACRASYAIRQGNLEEAVRWTEQLPDVANMFPMDWHIPARLLLAQGKKEDAAQLLQNVYARVVQFGAYLHTIPLRVYQALAAANEEAAIEFLAEALTRAEPEGVVRYFVDEGRLIKPLLEKALARGITPGFTRNLLHIIDEEERLKQATKGRAGHAPPPGPLSQRELEVLRLLTDDMPNQRIAERLSVSLGTVKTHVHHIIDKLGVENRHQAVQRARSLNLI